MADNTAALCTRVSVDTRRFVCVNMMWGEPVNAKQHRGSSVSLCAHVSCPYNEMIQHSPSPDVLNLKLMIRCCNCRDKTEELSSVTWESTDFVPELCKGGNHWLYVLILVCFVIQQETKWRKCFYRILKVHQILRLRIQLQDAQAARYKHNVVLSDWQNVLNVKTQMINRGHVWKVDSELLRRRL